jgi:alanine dehydrogenase
MFEEGYGESFGISNETIEKLGAKIVSRKELFELSDLIILPKPVVEDLQQMKEGQTLCGWTHAVQQTEITQLAIDKKLTLIAWEEMNAWTKDGKKSLHCFYRNNEMAGYAGVIHYLGLMGMDGMYGPRRKVSVLGFGSVSKGAIYALQGRGFNNIHVFTKRPTHLIADKNPDVYYHQLKGVSTGSDMFAKPTEGHITMLIDELADSDIIVNGVLQDVNDPLMFISKEDDLKYFRNFTSIIDISCDENMGFYFAKPTTFEEPTFKVNENITYYSVDHTPSYLWDAASREISLSLLPYLEILMKGPVEWFTNETVTKAIDINCGDIRNSNIISFQKRSKDYPYKKI